MVSKAPLDALASLVETVLMVRRENKEHLALLAPEDQSVHKAPLATQVSKDSMASLVHVELMVILENQAEMENVEIE